ncbi:hypothetical protein B4U80_01340 [Leptotrombidium deliense]|uniref:Uncharacterized protein n=1 Tax=Leptotrombidium deliense TaxID=299467 RepID=A0A443RYC4_9ACAR|nr:hypothetical protein B4U80_01340 [Leptotrombidium deliense]
MYLGKRKWIEGTVHKRTRNVAYEIHANGKIHRRHMDQLRRREEPLEFTFKNDLNGNSTSFNQFITEEEQQPFTSNDAVTPQQGTIGKYQKRCRELSPLKSLRVTKPPERYDFDT